MILAANWKMHKTAEEAAQFIKAFCLGLEEWVIPTVILAPFTALAAVGEACRLTGVPRQRLAWGAQNMYFEQSGAFTGEVSASMLLEHGCRYVLCGHSERRHVFGESDELVGKKVSAALAAGLIPIFCIGETLPEREEGNLESVLMRQIEGGLGGLTGEDFAKIVVAYEPVWAIGTGVVATPEQAQKAHAFARAKLVAKFGHAAKKVPILYGGSVKPDNIRSLVSLPDIDGALVGGASLKVENLLALHDGCVKAAKERNQA